MPRTGVHRTGKRAILAAQRQRRALELRLAGCSLREIAEALGYANQTGASKAITTALQRTIHEPAEQVRQLELQRLDALLVAVWSDATSPDAKGRNFAIDRALAIMQRRAALLGLDAPQKIDIEHRIRALAEENGLDPDEAVTEARRILREARA